MMRHTTSTGASIRTSRSITRPGISAHSLPAAPLHVQPTVALQETYLQPLVAHFLSTLAPSNCDHRLHVPERRATFGCPSEEGPVSRLRDGHHPWRSYRCWRPGVTVGSAVLDFGGGLGLTVLDSGLERRVVEFVLVGVGFGEV